MKVQIICEKCGKIVELSSNNNTDCYALGKLNDAAIYCKLDITAEVTTDVDGLKEIEDPDEVEVDSTLNSMTFTCKKCGEYISLTDLTS